MDGQTSKPKHFINIPQRCGESLASHTFWRKDSMLESITRGRDRFRKINKFVRFTGDVGNYYYGQGHPMKPHRIRMAHNLILNYGLYRRMEVYRPHVATFEEMTKYHTDDYLTFLKNARPEDVIDSSTAKARQQYNVGEDCPVFYGVYEFCQTSCGGSLAAAAKLNRKQADITINWMGGLHHAKKSEASGFCYTNDIVLAILELLKHHQRVLYVDIDIHHGDGVEEAFYTTDRVMTVSFHKFGEYFPGTGDVQDVGSGRGKYYAVNCPLHEGIDDDTYQLIFRAVMEQVMLSYQPSAIVLQCGADSLVGDRLGCFNLSLKGHGKCVEFMKKFNLPLLLLGGGGYTIRNVARCWAYETSIALDVEISNELPYNDYFEYYSSDFKLHIVPSNMINLNTPDYLQKMQSTIFEHLRQLPHAPGVQMQPIKDEITGLSADETASKNPYKCFSVLENYVEGDDEFYEEYNTKPSQSERSHNLNVQNLSPETKRVRISPPQSPKNQKSPKSLLGSKSARPPKSRKYFRSTSNPRIFATPSSSRSLK